MGDTQSALRPDGTYAAAEEESQRAEDAEAQLHDEPKAKVQITEIDAKEGASLVNTNGHCEDTNTGDGEEMFETIDIIDKEAPNEADGDAEQDLTLEVTSKEATQNDINDGLRRFFSNIGFRVTVKSGSDDQLETELDPENAPEDAEPPQIESKDGKVELNQEQTSSENDSTACSTLTDVTSLEFRENTDDRTSKDKVDIVAEALETATSSFVGKESETLQDTDDKPPISPSCYDPDVMDSPVKRFFTTGIFSGLRKKKNPEDTDTAEKDLADEAEEENETTVIAEGDLGRDEGAQDEQKITPKEETPEKKLTNGAESIKSDIVSSQERVQDSPLKRFFASPSLMRFARKQQIPIEPTLLKSGEHVLDEQVSVVRSGQGQKDEDQATKVEETGAWASFKKLMTPKRTRKFREEPQTDQASEPVEGEKLSDSAEQNKQRKDSSISWEAVLCGSGRRKSQKEEMLESGNQARESKIGDSQEEESVDVVSSSVKQADASSDGEAGFTWNSFKKLITPKRKAREEGDTALKSANLVTHDDLSVQAASDNSGEKLSDEAAKAESDDESETPAVVPLSEFEDDVIQADEETLVNVDLAQVSDTIPINDGAEEHIIASEIKTSLDTKEVDECTDVISKQPQLSDIPEESIVTGTAPAPVLEEPTRDDTLAEDLTDITSEAVTAPEPVDTTITDETEMVSAVSNLLESSKTSGDSTPVPAFYSLEETDIMLTQVVETISSAAEVIPSSSGEQCPKNIAGSVACQLLGTVFKDEPSLLGIHRKPETTNIETVLNAEEIGEKNSGAAVEMESLSVLNKVLSTEMIPELGEEDFEQLELATDEVLEVTTRQSEEVQIRQVESETKDDDSEEVQVGTKGADDVEVIADVELEEEKSDVTMETFPTEAEVITEEVGPKEEVLTLTNISVNQETQGQPDTMACDNVPQTDLPANDSGSIEGCGHVLVEREISSYDPSEVQQTNLDSDLSEPIEESKADQEPEQVSSEESIDLLSSTKERHMEEEIPKEDQIPPNQVPVEKVTEDLLGQSEIISEDSEVKTTIPVDNIEEHEDKEDVELSETLNVSEVQILTGVSLTEVVADEVDAELEQNQDTLENKSGQVLDVLEGGVVTDILPSTPIHPSGEKPLSQAMDLLHPSGSEDDGTGESTNVLLRETNKATDEEMAEKRHFEVTQDVSTESTMEAVLDADQGFVENLILEEVNDTFLATKESPTVEFENQPLTFTPIQSDPDWKTEQNQVQAASLDEEDLGVQTLEGVVVDAVEEEIIGPTVDDGVTPESNEGDTEKDQNKVTIDGVAQISEYGLEEPSLAPIEQDSKAEVATEPAADSVHIVKEVTKEEIVEELNEEPSSETTEITNVIETTDNVELLVPSNSELICNVPLLENDGPTGESKEDAHKTLDNNVVDIETHLPPLATVEGTSLDTEQCNVESVEGVEEETETVSLIKVEDLENKEIGPDSPHMEPEKKRDSEHCAEHSEETMNQDDEANADNVKQDSPMLESTKETNMDVEQFNVKVIEHVPEDIVETSVITEEVKEEAVLERSEDSESVECRQNDETLKLYPPNKESEISVEEIVENDLTQVDCHETNEARTDEKEQDSPVLESPEEIIMDTQQSTVEVVEHVPEDIVETSVITEEAKEEAVVERSEDSESVECLQNDETLKLDPANKERNISGQEIDEKEAVELVKEDPQETEKVDLIQVNQEINEARTDKIEQELSVLDPLNEIIMDTEQSNIEVVEHVPKDISEASVITEEAKEEAVLEQSKNSESVECLQNVDTQTFEPANHEIDENEDFELVEEDSHETENVDLTEVENPKTNEARTDKIEQELSILDPLNDTTMDTEQSDVEEVEHVPEDIVETSVITEEVKEEAVVEQSKDSESVECLRNDETLKLDPPNQERNISVQEIEEKESVELVEEQPQEIEKAELTEADGRGINKADTDKVEQDSPIMESPEEIIMDIEQSNVEVVEHVPEDIMETSVITEEVKEEAVVEQSKDSESLECLQNDDTQKCEPANQEIAEKEAVELVKEDRQETEKLDLTEADGRGINKADTDKVEQDSPIMESPEEITMDIEQSNVEVVEHVPEDIVETSVTTEEVKEEAVLEQSKDSESVECLQNDETLKLDPPNQELNISVQEIEEKDDFELVEEDRQETEKLDLTEADGHGINEADKDKVEQDSPIMESPEEIIMDIEQSNIEVVEHVPEDIVETSVITEEAKEEAVVEQSEDSESIECLQNVDTQTFEPANHEIDENEAVELVEEDSQETENVDLTQVDNQEINEARTDVIEQELSILDPLNEITMDTEQSNIEVVENVENECLQKWEPANQELIISVQEIEEKEAVELVEEDPQETEKVDLTEADGRGINKADTDKVEQDSPIMESPEEITMDIEQSNIEVVEHVPEDIVETSVITEEAKEEGVLEQSENSESVECLQDVDQQKLDPPNDESDMFVEEIEENKTVEMGVHEYLIPEIGSALDSQHCFAQVTETVVHFHPEHANNTGELREQVVDAPSSEEIPDCKSEQGPNYELEVGSSLDLMDKHQDILENTPELVEGHSEPVEKQEEDNLPSTIISPPEEEPVATQTDVMCSEDATHSLPDEAEMTTDCSSHKSLKEETDLKEKVDLEVTSKVESLDSEENIEQELRTVELTKESIVDKEQCLDGQQEDQTQEDTEETDIVTEETVVETDVKQRDSKEDSESADGHIVDTQKYDKLNEDAAITDDEERIEDQCFVEVITTGVPNDPEQPGGTEEQTDLGMEMPKREGITDRESEQAQEGTAELVKKLEDTTKDDVLPTNIIDSPEEVNQTETAVDPLDAISSGECCTGEETRDLSGDAQMVMELSNEEADKVLEKSHDMLAGEPEEQRSMESEERFDSKTVQQKETMEAEITASVEPEKTEVKSDHEQAKGLSEYPEIEIVNSLVLSPEGVDTGFTNSTEEIRETVTEKTLETFVISGKHLIMNWSSEEQQPVPVVDERSTVDLHLATEQNQDGSISSAVQEASLHEEELSVHTLETVMADAVEEKTIWYTVDDGVTPESKEASENDRNKINVDELAQIIECCVEEPMTESLEEKVAPIEPEIKAELETEPVAGSTDSVPIVKEVTKEENSEEELNVEPVSETIKETDVTETTDKVELSELSNSELFCDVPLLEKEGSTGEVEEDTHKQDKEVDITTNSRLLEVAVETSLDTEQCNVESFESVETETLSLTEVEETETVIDPDSLQMDPTRKTSIDSELCKVEIVTEDSEETETVALTQVSDGKSNKSNADEMDQDSVILESSKETEQSYVEVVTPNDIKETDVIKEEAKEEAVVEESKDSGSIEFCQTVGTHNVDLPDQDCVVVKEENEEAEMVPGDSEKSENVVLNQVDDDRNNKTNAFQTEQDSAIKETVMDTEHRCVEVVEHAREETTETAVITEEVKVEVCLEQSESVKCCQNVDPQNHHTVNASEEIEEKEAADAAIHEKSGSEYFFARVIETIAMYVPEQVNDTDELGEEVVDAPRSEDVPAGQTRALELVEEIGSTECPVQDLDDETSTDEIKDDFAPVTECTFEQEMQWDGKDFDVHDAAQVEICSVNPKDLDPLHEQGVEKVVEEEAHEEELIQDELKEEIKGDDQTAAVEFEQIQDEVVEHIESTEDCRVVPGVTAEEPEEKQECHIQLVERVVENAPEEEEHIQKEREEGVSVTTEHREIVVSSNDQIKCTELTEESIPEANEHGVEKAAGESNKENILSSELETGTKSEGLDFERKEDITVVSISERLSATTRSLEARNVLINPEDVIVSTVQLFEKVGQVGPKQDDTTNLISDDNVESLTTLRMDSDSESSTKAEDNERLGEEVTDAQELQEITELMVEVEEKLDGDSQSLEPSIMVKHDVLEAALEEQPDLEVPTQDPVLAPEDFEGRGDATQAPDFEVLAVKKVLFQESEWLDQTVGTKVDTEVQKSMLSQSDLEGAENTTDAQESGHTDVSITFNDMIKEYRTENLLCEPEDEDIKEEEMAPKELQDEPDVEGTLKEVPTEMPDISLTQYLTHCEPETDELTSTTHLKHFTNETTEVYQVHHSGNTVKMVDSRLSDDAVITLESKQPQTLFEGETETFQDAKERTLKEDDIVDERVKEMVRKVVEDIVQAEALLLCSAHVKACETSEAEKGHEEAPFLESLAKVSMEGHQVALTTIPTTKEATSPSRPSLEFEIDLQFEQTNSMDDFAPEPERAERNKTNVPEVSVQYLNSSHDEVSKEAAQTDRWDEPATLSTEKALILNLPVLMELHCTGIAKAAEIHETDPSAELVMKSRICGGPQMSVKDDEEVWLDAEEGDEGAASLFEEFIDAQVEEEKADPEVYEIPLDSSEELKESEQETYETLGTESDTDEFDAALEDHDFPTSTLATTD